MSLSQSVANHPDARARMSMWRKMLDHESTNQSRSEEGSSKFHRGSHADLRERREKTGNV